MASNAKIEIKVFGAGGGGGVGGSGEKTSKGGNGKGQSFSGHFYNLWKDKFGANLAVKTQSDTIGYPTPIPDLSAFVADKGYRAPSGAAWKVDQSVEKDSAKAVWRYRVWLTDPAIQPNTTFKMTWIEISMEEWSSMHYKVVVTKIMTFVEEWLYNVFGGPPPILEPRLHTLSMESIALPSNDAILGLFSNCLDLADFAKIGSGDHLILPPTGGAALVHLSKKMKSVGGALEVYLDIKPTPGYRILVKEVPVLINYREN